MTSRRFAKGAVALLTGTAGALSGLALGQAFLVRANENQLADHAAAVLTHAVDVADASRNVMTELNASPCIPCSADDLSPILNKVARVDIDNHYYYR